MTPMASLLIFAILSMLSITKAQGRAPHGIAYENPMAFSPSAFEFFHPNAQQPTSPLPIAATVQSTPAHESRSAPNTGGSRMGAGGIATIIFGFVFAVLLTMGVYYVVITRRVNLSRTKSVQPDV